MDWLQAGESFGTVTAAGIAAVAAFLSRGSARESNAAAATLSDIERQRRHSELCPRLRVSCEPLNAGGDVLRLQIMLAGPPGLDRVDRLTVTVRNDHFLRGEGHRQVMGGVTQEQIEEHIWGPYRLLAAPTHAEVLGRGRSAVYNAVLPLGEELPFQLEPSHPGSWMNSTTPEHWRKQMGSVIRLAVTAEHADYGSWYLPVEIDTEGMPSRVVVP